MTTSHYQAARENLFGHVPFLQRRMPGMLIRDLGGALLVDSGLGSDTFNKVLWECGGDGRPCRVERGAEDGLLQASKDWFANAPGICWSCREWPFPRRRSDRLRCGPAPRTKAR